MDSKNFVDLIEETVETIKECPETDVEEVIRNSWSFDDQVRRNAFSNFAEFRQHVLNVLDATEK